MKARRRLLSFATALVVFVLIGATHPVSLEAPGLLPGGGLAGFPIGHTAPSGGSGGTGGPTGGGGADRPVTVILDGKVILSDLVPWTSGDQVLVPVRTLAEAFGLLVGWDEATRSVVLTSPPGMAPPASAPPGGSADPGGGNPSGPGLFPGLDAAALVRETSKSVVAVLCYNQDRLGNPIVQGWGTGFVVSPDGLVFTNAHVVAGATHVKVVFADGTTRDVTVGPGILTDRLSDVAVIRLGPGTVPPLPLGDSDRVQVGEPVIAIGNPATMRLRNSVTAGVVSGVARGLDAYYSFIQTDAAINPGNSGGPLLNARGEVIGIITMKYIDQAFEGLGFAIPINVAQSVAMELLTHGRVIRPWLGATVEESWEASYGIPTSEGLFVSWVDPTGPAARAGIGVGDYIVAVDGRPTHSLHALSDVLVRRRVGDSVRVTVSRGLETISLSLVLAERPAYLDG